MKLIIKNFGPIRECVIDLSKRYYFFVGYNNTGKTYLSKLIYDIFNKENLSDFTKSVYSKNSITNIENSKIVLDETTIRSLLDSFSSFLKENVIPKSLKTNHNNAFILNELDIHFDFDFEKDVKVPPLKSGAAIGIKANEIETGDIEIYSLTKAANSLEIECEYFNNEDIAKKLPRDFFDNIAKKRFEKELNSIREDSAKDISKSLLSLLLQNKSTPFFLPANRIFILENADDLIEQDNKRKDELTKSLLELLESKEENNQKIGNLMAKSVEGKHTLHINNLIAEVSKLRKNKDDEFIRNGTGYFNELILDLTELLGGEIVISKSSSVSNGLEKFKIVTQNNEPKLLDMFLASSSINQLGTLFLYLKYWAKAGENFLMIDEPEENLHPKSQIKLVDLLLSFANRSNRILITTHSPLVVEIINNYLTLSQLTNKKEMAEQHNLLDIDISPDTVGIYYFNGETVTEHKIGNYGTIFSSFKEAQDNIYGIGDFLGEQMFKQLNKS